MGNAALGTGDRKRARLQDLYDSVRHVTHELAKPLAIEDYGLQAMADVSPPKWHLAHTSWFFETFVLGEFSLGYAVFHPEYRRLFNSYYETIGTFWPRAQRGLLSRPTVEDIYQYRQYVDDHMRRFMVAAPTELLERAQAIIVLGLNHEQQHQELLLTDTKYNLGLNPLYPVYRSLPPISADSFVAKGWTEFAGGLMEVGYSGKEFCFDNELPVHRQWLEPYRLGNGLVTNREYLEFMEDGGYRSPTLWLSAGWSKVRESGWESPLYWVKRDGKWHHFTLAGLKTVDWEAPVAHVSYFEADAFARWANKRLPREGEWEAAARGLDAAEGNFLDSGKLQPDVPRPGAKGLSQMFGDVWEWTQSAYAPYPGYRTEAGALGEYNGKFMSSQQVLRGGSCATPSNHIRPSYRNFFPPDAQWQFSGIRLAEDLHG